jgi:succinate dehydrogenase/fumarate reductase flavoprotein subunit
VTHLGRNQIEAFVNERFPNFTFRGYNLLKAGVDPRVDALEVAPIAHFYMGGVHYNERCETLVPGLFVAGEMGAGVHGANRVEGNALSEIQVYGAIAGETAAEYAARLPAAEVDEVEAEAKREERLALLGRSGGVRHWELRHEAQEIMWRQVGVVRTGEGLEKAVERLTSLREQSDRISVADTGLEGNREFMEALETQNMLMLAEAMARAALVRTESRGSHFRRDYPEEKNPEWLKNTVVTLEGEALKVGHRAVEFPYYDREGNQRPPVA